MTDEKPTVRRMPSMAVPDRAHLHRDSTARHDALAEALFQQIQRIGKAGDPTAMLFVMRAREGWYVGALPHHPEHIGLTHEEFRALRALIYG